MLGLLTSQIDKKFLGLSIYMSLETKLWLE